jgi:hypothetical protein
MTLPDPSNTPDLDYAALNRRLMELCYLQETRGLTQEEITQGIIVCRQLRRTSTPSRPSGSKQKKPPIDLDKLKEDLLS